MAIDRANATAFLVEVEPRVFKFPSGTKQMEEVQGRTARTRSTGSDKASELGAFAVGNWACRADTSRG